MNAHLFLKFFLSTLSFFILINGYGQQDSLEEITLPSVIVKAFEQNRRLKDVPAPVNYLGRSMLDRFNTTSIVAAVNSTPGVRMEERSPGSYRMNIRGSSLRSPFGVRNVKIYYNDIPYTDPGGQSYFNQLGFYNFNSLEIIKGANNSLYGAGTGGVMLIESLLENDKGALFTEYSAGSYGLQNFYASLITSTKKAVNKIGFQHQSNDGYRDHSKLQRDVFAWNGNFRVGENNLLKTSFLYGDLFYQTPGALTKAEFELNPKAPRPGNAAFPGAVAANASIRQRMFLAGASYTQFITSNLQNKTTLYGIFSELRNPAISNYGKNSEPHAGGRTVFKYSILADNTMIRIDAGAEVQEGFGSYSIHKNSGGNQDSLRSYDEVNNRQRFIFSQFTIEKKSWTIITGASWNTLKIKFQRFSPATPGPQNRDFNNGIAPRLTVMKKFTELNIYAGIAKGFSPPTTAELLPTGSAINLGLNAEKGTNYEVGMKGNFFKDLYADINAFYFSLRNTIVLRRNAAGGDFYLNAGSTRQYGIETSINYPLFARSAAVTKGFLWLAHTWHNFHYREFKQLANDFSGKRLPSVAPHTLSTGINITMKTGLLAALSYYYSDKIALNDANSLFAKAYHLLGAKVGYEGSINNKTRFKIFAGAENLLDESYSLGNDINGFGGRHYNAAAGRNYQIGITFVVPAKKNSL